MAVRAGPFPGSPGFDDFRASWGERRKNKRNFNNDATYSRQSSSKPEYKTLTSSLGETYKIPVHDFKELEEYLHQQQKGGNMQLQGGKSDKYKNGTTLFGKPAQYLKNVTTPEDYIDYGFSDKQKKNIADVNINGGHITYIAYNATHMLMKVRFEKVGNFSDTVVFFNLPANIAMTLMYLGRNGTMAPPGPKGEERHAVGVEFWNLVRVRGTVHGTRFQWIYDYGSGALAASGAGSFTQSDANRIANTVQEPKDKNFETPNIAQDSSKAADDYNRSDIYEMFSRKGRYHEWLKDYKRKLAMDNQTYMLNLLKKAEQVYPDTWKWESHDQYQRSLESEKVQEVREILKELAGLGMQLPEPSGGSSYGDRALGES